MDVLRNYDKQNLFNYLIKSINIQIVLLILIIVIFIALTIYFFIKYIDFRNFLSGAFFL